jgi:hypothetical protein
MVPSILRGMPCIPRKGPVRLLVLLAVLQAGCLSDSDSVEVAGECGPRDLTPECCLKKLPGEWERCTGSTEMAQAARRTPSVALKAGAVAGAGAMAVQHVRIGSVEQRDAELAANLLAKVEKAIVQCARKAEQQVNDYHFDGKSPSWEICQQVKVGEQTTWAAYLGLFKHERSWPCLHKALDALLPKKSYLLHPRFQFNEREGKWEHMDENWVSQIVAKEGWTGLRGTIEPDIVLLDKNGIIVHVYDLKFPCPETNDARWGPYDEGPWKDWHQGDLYKNALG